jgi:hypothetical protein
MHYLGSCDVFYTILMLVYIYKIVSIIINNICFIARNTRQRKIVAEKEDDDADPENSNGKIFKLLV